MARRLLAAGIVRDLEFDSRDRFYLYLYELEHRSIQYKVLDTHVRSDGSFIVRIVQQYNQADLIQLYED